VRVNRLRGLPRSELLREPHRHADRREARCARHRRRDRASRKRSHRVGDACLRGLLRVDAGGRWNSLALHGAHPQRLLWASTSNKDPESADTKYVDALIGPQTVNTMPRKTLDAFRHHGCPALRLEHDLEGARGCPGIDQSRHRTRGREPATGAGGRAQVRRGLRRSARRARAACDPSESTTSGTSCGAAKTCRRSKLTWTQ
jgi:hypothetical protein